LLSKSKQSEPKLVGRVGLDMGKLMNGEMAGFEVGEYKL
jgi:hypothetical protein